MGKLVHEQRLRGVHPQLVLMARAWSVQLPFDILITDGVRLNSRQRQLYEQGRSTPGPIVTMASSTESAAHGRRLFSNDAVFGCAIDAAPCTGVAGQPNYADDGAYEAMAIIAERMGLVWGGRWKRFTDKPHFEWPTWKESPPAADDVPDFSDVEDGSV